MGPVALVLTKCSGLLLQYCCGPGPDLELDNIDNQNQNVLFIFLKHRWHYLFEGSYCVVVYFQLRKQL